MSDPGQRLTLARAQLLRGWQAGACPPVEAVLSEHPDLGDDPAAVTDLVHVEAVLRQIKGESVEVTDLGSDHRLRACR